MPHDQALVPAHEMQARGETWNSCLGCTLYQCDNVLAHRNVHPCAGAVLLALDKVLPTEDEGVQACTMGD